MFEYILFIAYVLGAILNIAIPFYNRWKEDGRPFNAQYYQSLVWTILGGIVIILTNYLSWTPPDLASGIGLCIVAFLAGYGGDSALKSLLENFGLIDMTKNIILPPEPIQ